MKNEMVEIAKKEIANFGEKKISRKEAIKRTGYIAASAATMMILLSNPAQAGGPEGSPTHGNNGYGNGHQDAPGKSGGHNNAENSKNSKIWKK